MSRSPEAAIVNDGGGGTVDGAGACVVGGTAAPWLEVFALQPISNEKTIRR
jgi:hypothetical protein